jgi:uracil-DNA glycosylase
MPLIISQEPFQMSHLKAGQHVAVFPALANKKLDTKRDEISTQLIYQKYPESNYYKEHQEKGQRGKLGNFRVNTPVINFFVRLYLGTKLYPTDNPTIRMKNLVSIFKGLATQPQILCLHLPIFSGMDGIDDAIKDFCNTYQLHHNKPVEVILYQPAINEPVVLQSKDQPQIVNIKNTVFRLSGNITPINDQPLYLSDLAIGKLQDSQTTIDNIMRYFPNQARWSDITGDSQLHSIAMDVSKDLKDKIGSPHVFPPPYDLFNAFAYLQSDPKIVIIGQDPYHRPGQAHGLSFSVKPGVAIPPSLRNIYKALEEDQSISFKTPDHGCLTGWARQGVVLLNASLTVEEGKPDSHKDYWVAFTNRLLYLLTDLYPDVALILWGEKAKKIAKSASKKHSGATFECGHPSPMGLGSQFPNVCRHFSQVNQYLSSKNKTPIDWCNLPPEV